MNVDLEGYVYEFSWLKRTRDDYEVVSFYYFLLIKQMENCFLII